MKFYLAVTDNNWFSYLSHLQPEEINFWQPGGSQSFSAIEPGAPFLFKLHSPHNYIVGGGFFVWHSFLPISLAWDSFEKKNGAENYQTFKAQIIKYRTRNGKVDQIGHDPTIGCIILASPFFFAEPDWIPVSQFWPANIVQGKTFNTEDETGKFIWEQVSERLNRQIETIPDIQTEPTAVSVRERNSPLGDTLSLLIPVSRSPLLKKRGIMINNGIRNKERFLKIEKSNKNPNKTRFSSLACVKVGRSERGEKHPGTEWQPTIARGELKQLDLVTEVSPKIKEDFGNGREYYTLHGKKLIVLPKNVVDQPSAEFTKVA